jgi:uncharacterized membrane protein
LNQRYNLVPKVGGLRRRYSLASRQCIVTLAVLYALLLFISPPLGKASTFALFDGINPSGVFGWNILTFQMTALISVCLFTVLELYRDAKCATFREDFSQNFLQYGTRWWLISLLAGIAITAVATLLLVYSWTFSQSSARDTLMSTRLGAFAAFLGLGHFIRLTALHTGWATLFLFKK